MVVNLELSKESIIEILQLEGISNLTKELADVAHLSSQDVFELIKDFLNGEEGSTYISKIYEAGFDHTVIKDTEVVLNNLKMILELENLGDKLDIIMEMYNKNNDILNTNFKIFDDKYMITLGKDKINQMSCYPQIIELALKLDSQELSLVSKCLDKYMEENETEEWTVLCERLLNNIDSYKELISSIENVDDLSDDNIARLTYILSQKNIYGLKDFTEINEFDQRQIDLANKLIRSEDMEQKREAIFLIKFGQDLDEVKKIVRKYGACIDSIQDEDLKNYVKALSEIIKEISPEILDRIFNEVEPVQDVNGIMIERMLKSEYGKLYNEGLFSIASAKRVEEYGENVYEIPTDDNGRISDFRMIITSIAPFFKNQPDNFFEDWNRPAITSQHFCCSYIRRDMLGKTDIPHLCYGFSEMDADSLMLSGHMDIFSSGRSFVSEAKHDEEYLSPDEQINNTSSYNEMDYRRMQNGKKKLPDYIVVFRANGEIPNMETAQKASKQFEEATGKALPIVIVDEDKCRETERDIVNEMIQQCTSNRSVKLAESILQKIKNNGVAIGGNFMDDVDLTEINKIAEIGRTNNDDIVSNQELDEMIENTQNQYSRIYAQIKKTSRTEGVSHEER